LAIAVCIAASILATPPAIAQDHDHQHDDAGALGEVNFPVSCNPQAQSRFNTLAALLYSFYWAKAVASLDNPLGAPPTPQLEQQGWAAVEQAKQLGGKTPRERDYIAAVETVFKDYATVPF